MSTRQETVDYLLEQMDGAGPVSARKMFGEFAIYRADKFVALVCDDELFVKPTEAGKAYLAGAVDEAPPYPRAKPHFRISGDRIEDADWLAELIKRTDAALPAPKPKRAKPARKRKG
jgi:TfoX/Sxy family transcriptional regulator of competence genes